MRLRNIPRADAVLSACPLVIKEPETHRGKWNADIFQNTQPIHIEIGMGKGQFIMALARKNPQINYIGVERYTSVLLRALQKMEQEPLDNLHFLCIDAKILPDVFSVGEADRIYLNFSDPWPKDRHAKRRLTSRQFMERYNIILSKDGFIQFKTDNRPLFDFSVEEIKAAGWCLSEINYCLHKNGPAKDNVMTEYEQKFYNLGNPIYRLTAHRQD